MQADIIRIGNSKGVRIPAAVLKECGIEDSVELLVSEGQIILKPLKQPRAGWEAAFKQMHAAGDDVLIVAENLDDELLEKWDEN